jgi:hypothetical protein
MIFVTGGTGLLGSHLLYELVRSGKPVRALKRSCSDTAIVKTIFSYYSNEPEQLFRKIEWFEADLMDFAAMEEALEGITEVYHCGAVVSFYPRDHARMLRVNIEGTANLVNLCLENNVSKFLYVSSIATLGRADSHGLTTEESYWKTSSANTRYSVSKYGAEREVWRGMEDMDYRIGKIKTFRLMKENRLLLPPKKKRTPEFVRFTQPLPFEPSEKLEMDIKFIYIRGERKNALLITILDTFTRLALSLHLQYSIRHTSVGRMFDQVIKRWLQPYRPLKYQSITNFFTSTPSVDFILTKYMPLTKLSTLNSMRFLK